MDLQRSPQQEINLSIPPLSAELLKDRFFKTLPELQDLAHCDVDILLNRDSAHIGPEEWIVFAQKIESQWAHYDGFVLLHGTDTLAYTASALSFLLRPCLKPVVITGAQRPLSSIRTDARTNLISAVEIAANGPRNLVNQVTVFFHDRLFQGNRVRKVSATEFAAFDSPYSSPLALVGTTIRYQETPHSLSFSNLPLKPVFHTKTLMLHVTPGFPAQSLNQPLLSGISGIVLIVFPSLTAPTHMPDFVQFLKKIREHKIPLVITTHSSSQPPYIYQSTHYGAGAELTQEGCFSAQFMTPECAFVKTSYLLAQTQDLDQFGELWKQRLANE
jgi:L-asparaginase